MCGAALQNCETGMAIPARATIRTELGQRVYLDPNQTAAQFYINESLIKNVFANPHEVSRRYLQSTSEEIVYHVTPQLFSRVVYSLPSITALATPENLEIFLLLEAARRELSSIFIVNVMVQQGLITQAQGDQNLLNMSISSLRYFAAASENSKDRPLVIFHTFAFKTYAEKGYLQFNTEGYLVIDDSRSHIVLEEFQRTFIQILDLIDACDWEGLHAVLFAMAFQNSFVKKVIGCVRGSAGK